MIPKVGMKPHSPKVVSDMKAQQLNKSFKSISDRKEVIKDRISSIIFASIFMHSVWFLISVMLHAIYYFIISSK